MGVTKASGFSQFFNTDFRAAYVGELRNQIIKGRGTLGRPEGPQARGQETKDM